MQQILYKRTTDQKLYIISLFAYLSRIVLVDQCDSILGTATKLSETETLPLETFKGGRGGINHRGGGSCLIFDMIGVGHYWNIKWQGVGWIFIIMRSIIKAEK